MFREYHGYVERKGQEEKAEMLCSISYIYSHKKYVKNLLDICVNVPVAEGAVPTKDSLCVLVACCVILF